MIRWSVQMGYITIPKSSRQERVLENAQVFDWTISAEDIKVLVSNYSFLYAFLCLPACQPCWLASVAQWSNAELH